MPRNPQTDLTEVKGNRADLRSETRCDVHYYKGRSGDGRPSRGSGTRRDKPGHGQGLASRRHPVTPEARARITRPCSQPLHPSAGGPSPAFFPEEPAYRSSQIHEWLYDHPVLSADSMTNLPKVLRESLRDRLWPLHSGDCSNCRRHCNPQVALSHPGRQLDRVGADGVPRSA